MTDFEDMSFVEIAKSTFVSNEGFFPPTIMAFRDEHLELIVSVPEGQRVDTVGKLMALLLSADKLVTMSDTYHSALEKNPLTGQDWEPGDMQELADNDGREKGWVSDALVISEHERFGAVQVTCLPYSSGPPLQWGDQVQLNSREHGISGAMSDLFNPDPPPPPIVDSMPQSLREAMLHAALRRMGCLVG